MNMNIQPITYDSGRIVYTSDDGQVTLILRGEAAQKERPGTFDLQVPFIEGAES